MQRTTPVLTCLVLTLCSSLAPAADDPKPATAGSGYKIVKEWSIGGDQRWDYLTLDAAARRLYVARNSHVGVFDADTGAVVGDIPKTAGVHGVAVVPDAGHGFTSNGTDGTVLMFDLKTLKPLDTIRAGTKPDAIMFDPVSGRVFAFNGDSQDATAIDPATGKVAGTVALGGAPEFAVSDGKGKVFVNLEDKNEVVAIDAKALEVAGRWPLAPATTPTGLAIDPERRRLFVGCRSKVIVVMDADSGKRLASLPIGAGVDATAFDKETGLAMASCGDGTLTVVGEKSPGEFVVLDTVKTLKGSKTMALDPKTHNLYVAGLRPAAADGKPPTFVILVLGRD